MPVRFVLFEKRHETLSDDLQAALQLAEDIEPVSANDLIVKAIVYTLVGQPNGWVKSQNRTSEAFPYRKTILKPLKNTSRKWATLQPSEVTLFLSKTL